MKLSDWLIVFATLLSPLIAVQVSVFIQHRKEKREQRLQVFRTLMATRAANLTPAHVEALNMIDFVFYGSDKMSKAVVEACKVYLEHHNRAVANDSWRPKKQELFIDLLQKMAVCLGYDFDKVSIERTSYFPKGFGDTDWEQEQIRKLLLSLLKGERSLPICVGGGQASQSEATATSSDLPEKP